MGGSFVIEIQGLTKHYRDLVAIDQVSFKVGKGEIVGFLGPNGAGKTTTFAAIAGFVRPDSGRVTFAGTDITGWPPPRIAALGMVRTFQVTQPFAGLTVAENIRIGAFLRETNPAAAMDHARDVGAKLGLAPLLDRPAASLTVAARKRLEVARALATNPRLLLLDEVMAGLNPSEIHEIVALIRNVAASGVTILMIEHIMQAVAALAAHVFVLAEGALIAQGTPTEIATNPQVIEAYLGAGAAKTLGTQ